MKKLDDWMADARADVREPDQSVGWENERFAQESRADMAYRSIVCNLPRCLHRADRETQMAVIAEAPALTGTPWDAMVAGIVEHFALRHGLDVPAWTADRERFLDRTWWHRYLGHDAAWIAMFEGPASCAARGTPVHPADLDDRGGSENWEPEIRRRRWTREDPHPWMP